MVSVANRSRCETAVALYVCSSRLVVHLRVWCLDSGRFGHACLFSAPSYDNGNYSWPVCFPRRTFFREEVVFRGVSQARALGAAPCCIAARLAVVCLSRRQVVLCEIWSSSLPARSRVPILGRRHRYTPPCVCASSPRNKQIFDGGMIRVPSSIRTPVRRKNSFTS